MENSQKKSTYRKEYYEAKKDSYRTSAKKYYEANKEKIRQSLKQYRRRKRAEALGIPVSELEAYDTQRKLTSKKLSKQLNDSINEVSNT